MTSQEFEQMLSHNPDKYEGVCIRDLIYEYYFKKFNSYGDANQMTKAYTDELYKIFVIRTA